MAHHVAHNLSHLSLIMCLQFAVDISAIGSSLSVLPSGACLSFRCVLVWFILVIACHYPPLAHRAWPPCLYLRSRCSYVRD
eukprot:1546368-Amphidinium_carterae.2